MGYEFLTVGIFGLIVALYLNGLPWDYPEDAGADRVVGALLALLAVVALYRVLDGLPLV